MNSKGLSKRILGCFLIVVLIVFSLPISASSASIGGQEGMTGSPRSDEEALLFKGETILEEATATMIPIIVWTEGNHTLTFFCDETDEYYEGDLFNGEEITMVWSGTDVTGGSTSSIFYPSVEKVVIDESFSSVKLYYLSRMFKDCSNLVALDGLSYLDTSSVSRMEYMFYGCKSLTRLDLSSFDTSRVTNMQEMFRG